MEVIFCAVKSIKAFQVAISKHKIKCARLSHTGRWKELLYDGFLCSFKTLKYHRFDFMGLLILINKWLSGGYLSKCSKAQRANLLSAAPPLHSSGWEMKEPGPQQLSDQDMNGMWRTFSIEDDKEAIFGFLLGIYPQQETGGWSHKFNH